MSEQSARAAFAAALCSYSDLTLLSILVFAISRHFNSQGLRIVKSAGLSRHVPFHGWPLSICPCSNQNGAVFLCTDPDHRRALITELQQVIRPPQLHRPVRRDRHTFVSRTAASRLSKWIRNSYVSMLASIGSVVSFIETARRRLPPTQPNDFNKKFLFSVSLFDHLLDYWLLPIGQSRHARATSGAMIRRNLNRT